MKGYNNIIFNFLVPVLLVAFGLYLFFFIEEGTSVYSQSVSGGKTGLKELYYLLIDLLGEKKTGGLLIIIGSFVLIKNYLTQKKKTENENARQH